MHCVRSKSLGGSRRVSRGGFLFLGALREILVISLSTGFVLIALTQANSIFSLPSLSDEPHALNHRVDPVLNFGFDQDKQLLIVHSWREVLSEIDLETGTASRRRTPAGLIAIATSETNSTTVLLSRWSDDSQNHIQIYITRGLELILSEDFAFKNVFASDVRISADGSVATLIGHDGTFVGWDLATPEPTRWELQLGDGAATSSLSPDGRAIFIQPSNRDASVYDARTGAKLYSLPRSVTCNRAVSWSSDSGRLAIGDQDGRMSVFETKTGRPIWQKKMDFLFARSLALSNQGDLLAVGGFDKTIHVWNLSAPADAPTILTGESDVVHNFVFTNSDSKLISGSAGGSIREWSLATRAMIRQLR